MQFIKNLFLRPAIRVAVGDGISKAIIVGINLYLIRSLAVDQYSHFTMLLNAIFLGYQLACGPLERLYIAQHEQYKMHLTSLRLILSLVSALAGVLLLWKNIVWFDAALIFIGVFILAAYQVLRIRLQQSLNFTFFSIAEILKNGLWLALLLSLLLITSIPPSTASILSLLTGTFIAIFMLKIIAASCLPVLTSSGSYTELKLALWDTRYVISYSLVGALVPYLPVMMATTGGSNVITATYGAAMRYQAILGMAVFAFNTVLLPQMATLGKNTRERELLMQRIKRSVPWAALLFIISISAIWFAIPYVDKGKYPLLRQTFLILSITPALSLISAPYVNMLLVDGKARTVLLSMCTGIVVGLTSYTLLGSSLNPLAPALSSLCTYFTITFTTMLCVTKNKKTHD